MQQQFDRRDAGSRRARVRTRRAPRDPGAELPGAPTSGRVRRRPPTWQLIVTGILVVFFGAQLFAGWKFLNDDTYPIVGSAMFNGPPNPNGEDFLVPRVIGTTADGRQVELDQRTFGLEPFEWRAWVQVHLERVGPADAGRAARELAAALDRQTGETLVTIGVWRVPARSDDLDASHLVRTVEL